MKINKDLRLRRIDNKNFIVAVGEKSKTFNNTVKLNDTAAEIFEQLQKSKNNEEIAKKFVKEYSLSFEQAFSDVNDVVLQFEKAGFFND